MDRLVNGMPAGEVGGVGWRKSRRSSPSGNCVEWARLPDVGAIAVRDSWDPDGPALIFRPAAVEAFVAGVRTGDLAAQIP
jgi:hypothetical protein